MIPTVVVLYLNVLIFLHVAACFDDSKSKWPVPYRYENRIFCVDSSYKIM